MGTVDELIDPVVVSRLRASFRAVSPTLDLSTLTLAEDAVVGTRLRQRVDIVRDALLADLPAGFDATARLVRDVLDEPTFAGWMIWPTTELVTTRALESGSVAHFDEALALLSRLTVGLTSEFAIRDLVIARPQRALDVMHSWTDHDDQHVRRLASEGSRAYLPWARRVPWLIAHPRATRRILDRLYRDPSEYVRRSVANHVNDLSRIDAAVAVDAASHWAAHPDGTTSRLLGHALRTLVKRADSRALELVGFRGANLQVSRPQTSADRIRWNDGVTFSSVVTNHGDDDATVAIDYSIGFQRANGSVAPKTFKLTSRRLAAGESVLVSKSHSFRPRTTRTYYPGPHYVTVQANGVLSPRADFLLEADGARAS